MASREWTRPAPGTRASILTGTRRFLSVSIASPQPTWVARHPSSAATRSEVGRWGARTAPDRWNQLAVSILNDRETDDGGPRKGRLVVRRQAAGERVAAVRGRGLGAEVQLSDVGGRPAAPQVLAR